jgi:BCD family chlorophyll transporter-like MFS transporter
MISRYGRKTVNAWIALGPRFLPFADAATADLPLSRLLRLSLFQLSVGMATVLLIGTLNRVMIVELKVATWLVATMVALPLVFAPFRVLIGHKSDGHVSAFGWRRVPWIWYGTVMQFSGLAIMPFALLVMTDAPDAPAWLGPGAAALAFFLTGAGLHTVQTAGLALATDIAPEDRRPRVVALLYVTLLLGMVGGALLFGWLLTDFSAKRLIQVVQGCAAATVVLNFIALWKQEGRDPARVARLREKDRRTPTFATMLAGFRADPRAARLLVTVAFGTIGFNMQDIILEPYGGEILGLSVSATTVLTAMLALGMLGGLALAARQLGRDGSPYRYAGLGIVIGIAGFSLIVFSAPLDAPLMFRTGSVLIGFGNGLFVVCTLIAAMELSEVTDTGFALGAWGAVQATAMGAGILLGGALRDVIGAAAMAGALGEALREPATGYAMVYHLEIILLFVSLVALGPLVATERRLRASTSRTRAFGLAEMPG